METKASEIAKNGKFSVRLGELRQQPGAFFCLACIEDKPASDASPDLRYCLACYDFLLKESEILSPGKRPKWVPKSLRSLLRR